MKYKLISLSGLIHVYTGEAKEYPSSYIYTASKVLESQCVLVDDQERAKLSILLCNPDVKGESEIQDRTLYFVDVEMEKVEQMKSVVAHWGETKWVDCDEYARLEEDLKEPPREYRTVMRFKEGETIKITLANGTKFEVEAKESQEEAWAELGDMLMLRNAVLKKLKAKFVLTRKPWNQDTGFIGVK